MLVRKGISKSVAAALAVIVVIAAVVGVYEAVRSVNHASATNTGYLTVAAQDPGPLVGVQFVYVGASEIQVHNTNGSWITVLSQAKTVRLNYVENTSAIFTTAEVPAGKYDMVRIIVPNGSVKVTVNTSIQPLPGISVKGLVNITANVPSGAQTGIKIYTNFTIQPGATYTLTLHFHLVETGKGSFLLTPQTNAQTNTSTQQFVSQLYYTHLESMAEGNVSALAGEYASQSTATWRLNVSGIVVVDQSASSNQNISTAWATIHSELNVTSYTVDVKSVNVSSDTAQAEGYITLTLNLQGKTYQITLLDQVTYTYNGELWLISSEQVSQTSQ